MRDLEVHRTGKHGKGSETSKAATRYADHTLANLGPRS